MTDFDVLVIGGGTGNNVAASAADAGLETALVESGPLGGTCLNRGCNPSKMLIQAANAVNAMFKHAGDYETDHTVANVVHGERRAVDLSAMPHAIFTEPQIAGVGATEDELREADRAYAVGRADYADSSMGRAKKLEHGFLKVLAAPDGEILCAHAIGYEASILIHEAVLAMRAGLSVEAVADTIHVHPTLSKIVESAFADAAN